MPPAGMIRLSGCGGPEGPVFPEILPVPQIARFLGWREKGKFSLSRRWLPFCRRPLLAVLHSSRSKMVRARMSPESTCSVMLSGMAALWCTRSGCGLVMLRLFLPLLICTIPLQRAMEGRFVELQCSLLCGQGQGTQADGYYSLLPTDLSNCSVPRGSCYSGKGKGLEVAL